MNWCKYYIALNTILGFSICEMATGQSINRFSDSYEKFIEINKNIDDLDSSVESDLRIEDPLLRASAMYVAGQMHMYRAIDTLVEQIDFESPIHRNDRPAIQSNVPWSKNPAVDALISIGPPCIESLIRILRTTDIISKRDKALFVLRVILHHSLGESSQYDDGRMLSKIILTRAIDRDEENVAKLRLKRAIKVIDDTVKMENDQKIRKGEMTGKEAGTSPSIRNRTENGTGQLK